MRADASPLATTGIDLQPFEWFLDTGRRSSWPEAAARLLPYLVGYAVLQGALVAAGLTLSAEPAAAVALWPAVGLLCAALGATHWRTWPLWIVAALVGRVACEYLLFDTRNLLAPVLFSGVNVLEALIFALAIQRPLRQAFRHGRPLYFAAVFVVAALASATVGGLVGAVAVQAVAYQVTDYWSAVRLWASGDFLGILLVAPPAAWLLLPQIRIRRRLAGVLERAAMPFVLLVVLTAALWLTPASDSAYRDAVQAGLAILMILPVLWAAIRADYTVVGGLQILLTLVIVLASINGVGPFTPAAAGGYLPALASMQTFLVVSLLAIMLVTFGVLERHRSRQQAEMHERFSGLLMTLTGRLMTAHPATLDRVVEGCLQLLAEFVRADRCMLLQIDDAKLRIQRAHAWAAEGLTAYPQELREATTGQFAWAFDELRDKGFLVVEQLRQPQAAHAEELALVRRALPDVGSFVVIGLSADAQLTGAIGFGFAAGRLRWTSVSSPLVYLVGQLFANIVRRKVTESDLDAYQLKLRSLATDLTAADERTRRKTAVDLHDGIGQNLAVARMKLGQLIAAGGNEAELTQVRNLVDDALRGTRYIIADLSPTILYELGLVPALQSLAERFEPVNDLVCRLNESGEPWQPDNDTRIALYRSVQECLINVAKHAHAQNVDIDVRWSDEGVTIDVRDDGVGLDAAEDAFRVHAASGFGLFSLRESLTLQGGGVTIESARGIGTTVTLTVPRREEGDDK